MKKKIQLLIIQCIARIKSSFSKKTLACEKADTKTGSKAYLTMPMAFDFTAYYDDNELENNSGDIAYENPLEITNTEFLCMPEQKCTEMNHSTHSQHFECCIN